MLSLALLCCVYVAYVGGFPSGYNRSPTLKNDIITHFSTSNNPSAEVAHDKETELDNAFLQIRNPNPEFESRYKYDNDVHDAVQQEDDNDEEPIFNGDDNRKGPPDYSPVVVISNGLATTTESDKLANAFTIVGKHEGGLVDLKKETVFKAIGYFTGRLGCSGAFIAPNVVLSAGHCIHPGGNGEVKAPSSFYRQRDCKKDGVKYTVEKVILFKGWMDSADNPDDVSLLITKEPSEHVIDIEAISEDAMVGLQKEIKEQAAVAVIGYSRKLNSDGCMLKNPGFIMGAASDYIVYHDCDTATGMSGGPIYDTKSGKIRGVHTDGFGSKSKVQLNAGVAITTGAEATIKDLIKEHT